jgi:hypothetical protein
MSIPLNRVEQAFWVQLPRPLHRCTPYYIPTPKPLEPDEEGRTGETEQLPPTEASK